MIAKVIPLQRRGLFTGVGHGLGAFMGVIGAVWAGTILNWDYPINFVTLFLLAFAAMAISWVGLVLTREPDSPVVKEPVQLAHYLRRLPALLRGNGNFTRFLISLGIVKLGTMASGFFVVYGVTRFQLDGAAVGTMTAVLIGSQAVMNLVWGVLGDRRGHKSVLASSACALALAAASAWFAPGPGWLLVTFALLGAYNAGDTTSGLNIALEFCAPEDRPTFIGMTNTLLAPVITLAPLIGGWLAIMLGYVGMFVASALVAAVGAVLLTLWVREPRGQQVAPMNQSA
jgi:MFS family permease